DKGLSGADVVLVLLPGLFELFVDLPPELALLQLLLATARPRVVPRVLIRYIFLISRIVLAGGLAQLRLNPVDQLVPRDVESPQFGPIADGPGLYGGG